MEVSAAGKVEDNSDPNCYTRAYCYRNMKILRGARVLSLGFEIAAKNSNPDKPWTLKEVVDGFDDCKYAVDGAGVQRLDAKGKPIVIDDPSGHPFCHLIDPNWVLKAPPARCDNLAYNSLPLGQDMPTRQQSCVDLKTCVGYNKDGTCYAYGYCAREQNEWRFNLDKCDEQTALAGLLPTLKAWAWLIFTAPWIPAIATPITRVAAPIV